MKQVNFLPCCALSRLAGGRVFALIFVVAVHGLALAQFRPVLGREYREFHNAVNPVAGEAIVGISIVPTDAALRASAVQVLIPAAYSGEMSIETASADGRFRGEGLFSGSTTVSGWVTLPLAPASAEVKATPSRPSDPKALAIVARGPNGILFVTRWGDATQAVSPEQLRLYVNSRRAEVFLRAGVKLVRCSSIGVAQGVRFDSICDLPFADMPKDGRLTLVRRDQFDEQSQPLKVQMP